MKRNILIPFLTILLIIMGCANQKVGKEQETAQVVREEVSIGVINWPSDHIIIGGIAKDIENCLLNRIKSHCPNATLFDQDFIRDTLFPLLEPTTQPVSETDMIAMLSRKHVTANLREKNITFLVTFTVQTLEETHGCILPLAGYGAGGFFGLMWIDKETNISVAIWELDMLSDVKHVTACDEGTTWIPACILPIPLPAMTLTGACRKMTEKIVGFVKVSPHGWVCN